jgi:hypothetical protein
MRTLALILSLIAFVATFRLAECTFYSFYQTLPPALQPHAPGPEGGLIEAALDTMVGTVTIPLALLFAYLHLRRHRDSTIARLLLKWCWLLLLIFAVTLVKLFFFDTNSGHTT